MNDNVDQIDDRTHIEQQIARTSKTEKSCIYVSIIPIVWWSSRRVFLPTATAIIVGPFPTIDIQNWNVDAI